MGDVPAGLQKYSHLWKAPMPDYTINHRDKSIVEVGDIILYQA